MCRPQSVDCRHRFLPIGSCDMVGILHDAVQEANTNRIGIAGSRVGFIPSSSLSQHSYRFIINILQNSLKFVMIHWKYIQEGWKKLKSTKNWNMDRGVSVTEQRLAEKLTILNDRGIGMLTRIYNIKKVRVRNSTLFSKLTLLCCPCTPDKCCYTN